MSRIAAYIVLLLALATPALADGLSGADAVRYAAGVEELRAQIDWYPRGAARQTFKAPHIQVSAIFRRAGPGQPPLLRYARIIAPGGEKFVIPGEDREVRELVIRENGDMWVKLNGLLSFDIPVRLMANGGLRMDMPLWLGDKVFGPEKLNGGLRRWPPSLDDLLRMMTGGGQATSSGGQPSGGQPSGGQPSGGQPSGAQPSGGGQSAGTSFQGGLRWNISGNAAPFAFPLPIGEATAASQLRLQGEGEIRADGRFLAPIRPENGVFVRADLTRATLANQGGRVTLFGGSVVYQGRYGVSAGQGRTRLELDGQLDYALQLGRLEAQTEALRVTAEGGTLRGHAPLRGAIDANGGAVQSSLDASGGQFELAVAGPVTADVQTETAQVDLNGSGTLNVSGRFAEAGIDGLGIEDVILGARLTPGAGSTATVAGTTLALDDDDTIAISATGSVDADAQGVRLDLDGQLDGRGSLEARTEAGQATVDAQVVLDGSLTTGADGTPQLEASGPLAASFQAEDAALARPDGSQVHVGELDGTLQFELELSAGAVGVTGGQLDATARDVRLTTPATGGATPTGPPATPAPEPVPGHETVTVVAGDTLWAISQRFGVTVDALRDANGLAPGAILEIGDVLEIPGTAASQPVSQPAPPPPAPTAAFETPAANRLEIDEARVGLEIDSARLDADGLRVDGRVRGLVVLSTAEVATSQFEGTLLGAIEAQLPSTQVGLTRTAAGEVTLEGVDSLAIPFALRLDPGTWVRVPGTAQGRIDAPGSEVRGVAHVATGADGKLALTRIEQVEATLMVTGAMATGASVPAGATLEIRGRAALRPDGLDLFGTASVTLSAADDQTPILSVTW